MKKKIISVSLVLALSCACLFASFAGRSSIGVNYSYEDGNYLGLSTDHIGFINNAPVGYFIGADADFGIAGTPGWRINMLIGPAYRYFFSDVPISVDIAAGLSLGGASKSSSLDFGLGAYLGAAWAVTDHMEVLLGAKLGSNFVDINLDNPAIGIKGDFYVTPQIALGFTY